jgi:predicted transposase/invertase (TIGR01784 family)
LIEIERFPDVVKNALDEWIYFFKHSEIPPEFRARNIQVARDKLALLKMSDDDRRAYERFWLARASYQDEIASAKTQGREEGREEERYETARKMKAKGLDLALIAEISGLTEAELLAL